MWLRPADGLDHHRRVVKRRDLHRRCDQLNVFLINIVQVGAVHCDRPMIRRVEEAILVDATGFRAATRQPSRHLYGLPMETLWAAEDDDADKDGDEEDYQCEGGENIRDLIAIYGWKS